MIISNQTHSLFLNMEHSLGKYIDYLKGTSDPPNN